MIPTRPKTPLCEKKSDILGNFGKYAQRKIS
jgi:hypothetical protein